MEEIYNLKCIHKIYHQSFFCHICGAICIGDSFGIKPVKYQQNLEIDPNDIIKTHKNERDSINFSSFSNIPHGITKTYLTRRKKIFKKIKLFIDKYKFKDKSYYLAIYLLDVIINKCKNEKQITIESLAIGSVILASKINYN
jgi:hypothetical protein